MLNKIAAAAAIGAGIFAVITMGILPPPPPPPAKAYGIGGYTYTQRVCQEYGQQPRWYNVRDGQAAYNGGNSDSGWLIVLEHGGHEPAGWVMDQTAGTHMLYAGQYVRVSLDVLFFRDSLANYHAVTSRAAANRINIPGVGYIYYNEQYITHYRYNPGRGGGRYVRWANMAWCR